MKKLQRLGLKKNFSKEIAIIGVDYVGLPLAKSFTNHFFVKAFDKDKHRIKELQKGIDRNFDIRPNDLKIKTYHLPMTIMT
jgi:UDP-N-acetyl-D-mannosaminuronate dehydrogenase